MTIQSFAFSKPKQLPPEIVPTFEQLLEIIKSFDINDEIKIALLNKARRLPPGSYGHFIKNINHHIESVRK